MSDLYAFFGGMGFGVLIGFYGWARAEWRRYR